MKEKSILLSIFMLISIVASSQNFCFTPASTNNPELNNSSYLRATNDNYNYLLRIYFHVIRRSNGTGGQSFQKVSEAYNILNNDFNPHRIFFSWDGTIDYIDDDSRYNTPDISIYSVNNHQDGIDIYLYDDAASEGGRANGVGESSEFWISGRYWNPPFQSLITSHVISHEMGHVLFLWHTHHGTFNEGGNDNPCAELVNGSNSATCGDYVVDTPADPHLHFNVNQNTCQWNDSGRDANGHPYNPDTRLIMSYTDVGCMEYFSLKQGERMRNAIETLSYLQNTLILKYVKPSLSGPTSVCNQATYTVENLPSGATVQWSASNNIILSDTTNGSVLAVSGGNLYPELILEVYGWIRADIKIDTDTIATLIREKLSVSKPRIKDLSVPSTAKTGEVLFFTCSTYEPWRVDWMVTPNRGVNMNQLDDYMLNIGFSRVGDYRIQASGTNTCGTDVEEAWIRITSDNPCDDCPPPSLLSLTPNPATDVVTVRLNETETPQTTQSLSKAAASPGVYEIQLWSAGAMIRNYKTDRSAFEMPVSELLPGIYFVRILKEGKTYTEKLIKK